METGPDVSERSVAWSGKEKTSFDENLSLDLTADVVWVRADYFTFIAAYPGIRIPWYPVPGTYQVHIYLGLFTPHENETVKFSRKKIHK